jgi:hypothetical protein
LREARPPALPVKRVKRGEMSGRTGELLPACQLNHRIVYPSVAGTIASARGLEVNCFRFAFIALNEAEPRHGMLNCRKVCLL